MAASGRFMKKSALYQSILGYSQSPRARALARIALAKLTGLDASLTPEEARALFDSIEDQIESLLEEEAKALSVPIDREH